MGCLSPSPTPTWGLGGGSRLGVGNLPGVGNRSVEGKCLRRELQQPCFVVQFYQMKERSGGAEWCPDIQNPAMVFDNLAATVTCERRDTREYDRDVRALTPALSSHPSILEDDMANEKKQRWSSKVTGSVLSILRDKVEKFTLDTSELSEEIKVRLMMHGLAQKVKDSVAGLDKKGETVEGQTEIMLKVWDKLKNGEWSTRKPAEATTTLRGAVRQILSMNLPAEQEKQNLKMVFSLFGVNTVHEAMVEQIREELENEDEE